MRKIFFALFFALLLPLVTLAQDIRIDGVYEQLDAEIVSVEFSEFNRVLTIGVNFQNNTNKFIDDLDYFLEIYRGDALQEEGYLFANLDLVKAEEGRIQGISPQEFVNIPIKYTVPQNFEAGNYLFKLDFHDEEWVNFAQDYTEEPIYISGDGGFISDIYVHVDIGDGELYRAMEGPVLQIDDTFTVMTLYSPRNKEFAERVGTEDLPKARITVFPVGSDEEIISYTTDTYIENYNNLYDSLKVDVQPNKFSKPGSYDVQIDYIEGEDVLTSTEVRWFIDGDFGRVQEIQLVENVLSKGFPISARVPIVYYSPEDSEIELTVKLELFDAESELVSEYVLDKKIKTSDEVDLFDFTSFNAKETMVASFAKATLLKGDDVLNVREIELRGAVGEFRKKDIISPLTASVIIITVIIIAALIFFVFKRRKNSYKPLAILFLAFGVASSLLVSSDISNQPVYAAPGIQNHQPKSMNLGTCPPNNNSDELKPEIVFSTIGTCADCTNDIWTTISFHHVNESNASVQSGTMPNVGGYIALKAYLDCYDDAPNDPADPSICQNALGSEINPTNVTINGVSNNLAFGPFKLPKSVPSPANGNFPKYFYTFSLQISSPVCGEKTYYMNPYNKMAPFTSYPTQSWQWAEYYCTPDICQAQGKGPIPENYGETCKVYSVKTPDLGRTPGYCYAVEGTVGCGNVCETDLDPGEDGIALNSRCWIENSCGSEQTPGLLWCDGYCYPDRPDVRAAINQAKIDYKYRGHGANRNTPTSSYSLTDILSGTEMIPYFAQAVNPTTFPQYFPSEASCPSTPNTPDTTPEPGEEPTESGECSLPPLYKSVCVELFDETGKNIIEQNNSTLPALIPQALIDLYEELFESKISSSNIATANGYNSETNNLNGNDAGEKIYGVLQYDSDTDQCSVDICDQGLNTKCTEAYVNGSFQAFCTQQEIVNIDAIMIGSNCHVHFTANGTNVDSCTITGPTGSDFEAITDENVGNFIRQNLQNPESFTIDCNSGTGITNPDLIDTAECSPASSFLEV